MLQTDDLLLTRAQRDLYAELEGDAVGDLERFAERLVARVVNGSIAPSSLKGKPTVVMFFHPF